MLMRSFATKFYMNTKYTMQRAQNDPSNPVLHCNKDVCHSKIGQWERSVEDCNEALKIRPSYTKALHRRAASNAKKFLLQMVKTMRKFLMRLLQKRNQEQQDVEQSISDLVDKIKSSSHGQAMEMWLMSY